MWNWAQEHARFLVPWQNSYHISEVFREGLERIKVEPVFDTPEYPATQRRKMFAVAQAAKSQFKTRARRAIERSLTAVPGRPVVVVRSSRRSSVFDVCNALSPGSPHVLLWKGSPRFLEQLDEHVKQAYTIVHVPGDGFLSAKDGGTPDLARFGGAVVVVDLPDGALEKYRNVLEFARALRPSRLVALRGTECELLPLTAPESIDGPAVAGGPEHQEPWVPGQDVAATACG